MFKPSLTRLLCENHGPALQTFADQQILTHPNVLFSAQERPGLDVWNALQ